MWQLPLQKAAGLAFSLFTEQLREKRVQLEAQCDTHSGQQMCRRDFRTWSVITKCIDHKQLAKSKILLAMPRSLLA